MTKNIIIGIGNILFSDDGVGVYSAVYLKKNFTFEPPLEILDGGTLGIGLINYFTEYDNVFIVDTISVDDDVGSIYSIPSDELLGLDGYKNTAHEVEVMDMLKTASLLDKCAKVTIFGIVPYDIQKVQIGLTKTLENKFDILIGTIINGIEKLNIKVIKKDNYKLETIIKELKC